MDAVGNSQLSRFLPQDYDAQKPIAIIAGKALYPILLVEQIRKLSIPVRLIAFHDETEQSLVDSFAKHERTQIKVGQLGHMLKMLKKLDAGYAIMAGQITPKKLFKGLTPDLKAVAILAKLKERNAETIFGAIAQEIADIHVHQLDARSFLDDSLASPGVMTGGKLKMDEQALEHGIHIAKESARLDIGQSIVVNRGTVLAVEAFEGTDAMIERAGQFSAKAPIFIKTVKPKQDYRFDVPVFGMRTLEKLIQSNIKFAALEADNTIILEKEKVLSAAHSAGIQIFGYSS